VIRDLWDEQHRKCLKRHMRKKKDHYDGDDPRCTHPRCRTTVDHGSGIQWLDERKKWQRFCGRCYEALCAADEKKAEKKAAP